MRSDVGQPTLPTYALRHMLNQGGRITRNGEPLAKVIAFDGVIRVISDKGMQLVEGSATISDRDLEELNRHAGREITREEAEAEACTTKSEGRVRVEDANANEIRSLSHLHLSDTTMVELKDEFNAYERRRLARRTETHASGWMYWRSPSTS